MNIENQRALLNDMANHLIQKGFDETTASNEALSIFEEGKNFYNNHVGTEPTQELINSVVGEAEEFMKNRVNAVVQEMDLLGPNDLTNVEENMDIDIDMSTIVSNIEPTSTIVSNKQQKKHKKSKKSKKEKKQKKSNRKDHKQKQQQQQQQQQQVQHNHSQKRQAEEECDRPFKRALTSDAASRQLGKIRTEKKTISRNLDQRHLEMNSSAKDVVKEVRLDCKPDMLSSMRNNIANLSNSSFDELNMDEVNSCYKNFQINSLSYQKFLKSTLKSLKSHEYQTKLFMDQLNNYHQAVDNEKRIMNELESNNLGKITRSFDVLSELDSLLGDDDGTDQLM